MREINFLTSYPQGFPLWGGHGGGAPPIKSQILKMFFGNISKNIASQVKIGRAVASTHQKEHFKPLNRGRG